MDQPWQWAQRLGSASRSEFRQAYFRAAEFSGDVARIKRRSRISRQCHARQRFAVLPNALHKVLELLRVSMLPALIRSGMAPSLFGSNLLDQVNFLELVFAGVERLQRIDGVEIAPGAMVVADHFERVLHPAKNELRSKNVSHRSVGERYVDLGIVFDVVVTGPQEPCVSVTVQPGDLVGAGADR